MPSDVLARSFLRMIARHTMIRRGDRVAAAVSGGADSVALLHLLHEHRARLGIELACIHIHHGLRGAEADADAAFVQALADGLGVPCHVVRRDPAKWAVHGLSIQDAARRMRYEVFHSLAAQHGFTRVATAHTADDQAETVLLRILSGTGLEGLSGIRPVRDDLFIRPLLQATRDEVVEYLNARGLAWREDASNASPDYDRNRVRHELLPLLRERFNPRVRDALVRLSETAREDDAVLGEIARDLVSAHAREEADGLVFPSAVFRAQLPGMRLRLVRELFRRASGGLRGLSRAHCEAVDDLARPGGAGNLDLPGGVVFSVEGKRLCLSPSAPPLTLHLAIGQPGRHDAEELGVAFEVTPVDGAPPRPWLPDRTYLGATCLPDLSVRCWRRGDRMHPDGMEGTRKLQDLFTDAKLPRYRRSRVPLVLVGEEIAWVVGLRRDRRFLPPPGDPAVQISVRGLAADEP